MVREKSATVNVPAENGHAFHLFTIAAQSFEIDDRYPAIFMPQQAFLL
jgi:hypothetical protein